MSPSPARRLVPAVVLLALTALTRSAEAHALGIPIPHLSAGSGVAFEPARRLVLAGFTATSGLSSETNVDAILFQGSVYTSSFDFDAKVVPEGDLVYGTFLVAYRRYHRLSPKVEWYGTLWLGGGVAAQGLRGNQHLWSPTLAVSGDFGLRLASVVAIAVQGSYFAPLSGAPIGLTVQVGYP